MASFSKFKQDWTDLSVSLTALQQWNILRRQWERTEKHDDDDFSFRQFYATDFVYQAHWRLNQPVSLFEFLLRVKSWSEFRLGIQDFAAYNASFWRCYVSVKHTGVHQKDD